MEAFESLDFVMCQVPFYEFDNLVDCLSVFFSIPDICPPIDGTGPAVMRAVPLGPCGNLASSWGPA